MAAGLIHTASTVSLSGGGSSFASIVSGWTRFENQPWNTALPSGWHDDGGNWLSDKGSIVTDATAPKSPSNVVAGKFAAGDEGGSAPFYVYRRFDTAPTGNYKNFAVEMYVKHSANWDNWGAGGNGGTKFMWPAGDQVQGTATYLNHDGQHARFGISQQGGDVNPDHRNPDINDDLYGNRELYSNVGDPAVANFDSYYGTWVKLQVIMWGSSTDHAYDGSFKVWINDTLTHDHTGVSWQMDYFAAGLTPSQRKWLSLAWNPTYGGGFTAVPHDQFQYLDDLQMWGSDT